MGKLTKEKALTILLYDTMKMGVRKSTDFYMRVLEVNQKILYDPIGILSKNNLIKAHRGFTNSGIEKLTEVSLETLCSLLEIDNVDIETIINTCEEIVYAKRRVNVCSVCNECFPYVNKFGMCMDCIKLGDIEVIKKKARCGHLSATRYFNCEKCEPNLGTDETEYEIESFTNASSND